MHVSVMSPLLYHQMSIPQDVQLIILIELTEDLQSSPIL